jgi:hypothetical protein
MLPERIYDCLSLLIPEGLMVHKFKGSVCNGELIVELAIAHGDDEGLSDARQRVQSIPRAYLGPRCAPRHLPLLRIVG